MRKREKSQHTLIQTRCRSAKQSTVCPLKATSSNVNEFITAGFHEMSKLLIKNAESTLCAWSSSRVMFPRSDRLTWRRTDEKQTALWHLKAEWKVSERWGEGSGWARRLTLNACGLNWGSLRTLASRVCFFCFFGVLVFVRPPRRLSSAATHSEVGSEETSLFWILHFATALKFYRVVITSVSVNVAESWSSHDHHRSWIYERMFQWNHPEYKITRTVRKVLVQRFADLNGLFWIF